jgi:NAD(P)H-dependent FMN reductase
MKKIIAIPGSLRKESINLNLLKLISENYTFNNSISIMPQSKLDLPLYNQDSEVTESLKTNLEHIKNYLSDSDGILIACPEYNGSITGALKNFIDWVSVSNNPFVGKKVGMISTSPSPFGGIRGIMHLRDIMFNMGVILFPNHLSIPKNFNNGYSEENKKLIEKFTQSFFNFVL